MTPQGDCGAASRGTLTMQDGRFAFTPSDGVILVRGSVSADGVATGQLVTQGADKKPFVMSLSAKVSDGQVTGSYTTPRCTFTVSLSRR